MEDFLDERGNISIERARQRGKLGLLKKMSQGPKGETIIELMDQQRALEQIAKMLGMMAPTKMEVSGKDGGAIEITALDYRDMIGPLRPVEFDNGE